VFIEEDLVNIYMHGIAEQQTTPEAIGTFVQKPEKLEALIELALEDHDFEKGPFVVVPDAQDCVTCGVAQATTDPGDYTLREHRGEVAAYRARETLTEDEKRPDTVAAIIYTAEMFLADPQTSDEEKEAFVEAGYTHCWVTTLAMKGPKAPVGAWRFVVNLAGGNAMTLAKNAEELQAEATEIKDYWSEWSTVA
jgi:hypothetical protein